MAYINIKKTLLLLLLLFGLLSCKESDNKKQQKAIRQSEKSISQVNRSIDSFNAYNDLFLDSMSLYTYLNSDSMTLSNPIIKNRIISFYNSRNFQYAWFSTSGVAEETGAFWNMLMHYFNNTGDSIVYDDALANKMKHLLYDDSVRISNDSTFQELELDLTKTLYLYGEKKSKTTPSFNIKSLEWSVPKKKVTLEEALTAAINRENYFANENSPENRQYVKLREMLQKYYSIYESGGWDSIVCKHPILKIGYKGEEIRQIKSRLKREGYLSGDDSTFTDEYDQSLYRHLQRVKAKYGYDPNSQSITPAFISDLNISVEERLQQILINMDRMRWIPVETADSFRTIIVNIPEFKLHLYEEGKQLWSMDIVVGKEAHSTTLFTGNLNMVVFSPYWHIPKSIVVNEILPGMKKNPNYLVQKNMEIVADGQIPTIRQKPGGNNSLGRVKFLFPNSHAIYMHDSPAKSLFNKDKRAFSHGCIRLKEPAKMAEYLLDDTIKWNAEKVKEAMFLDKQKYVLLKRPIPVMITYFTAWVNGDDGVNFREDIYGHDERIAKKIFLNPVSTTRHSDKK